jgi:hypothetical protein
MTTSGTYSFNPSLGEIVLNAYARCGVRRTALMQEHMTDARFEANLMLASWANQGVNLWEVTPISVLLVQGQTTYSVPQKVVMILDAVIQQNTGTSSQFDRVIMPISRTEYSQTPNKLQQAPPTVFWFDRLINPTVTLWPVPDQSNTYTLNYYAVTQIQDAELTDAQTVDIPYRWLDAMASGLAARLSAIYAPERMQMLEAKAEQAYTIAATQDTENVPLYIMPGLSGYFRVS